MAYNYKLTKFESFEILKKTLYILLLLVTFQGFAQKTLDQLLQQYNTHSVPYISVEGLRALQVNEEIILLDTREASEFSVSNIEGSQCVGFNNFSAEEISEAIEDKDTPIVVYCSLGIRSEQVGEKLQKAGFTNVKNLYGGIFEWMNYMQSGFRLVISGKTMKLGVEIFTDSPKGLHKPPY